MLTKMKKEECAIMKEAYKQKQIIIDEIKDKFERAESAVVIDYIGITVAEADAMRKKYFEEKLPIAREFFLFCQKSSARYHWHI